MNIHGGDCQGQRTAQRQNSGSRSEPQHNSKPVQSYSEKEAREALLGLGITDEAADFYLLKLVPQLSGNQEVTFPPMDIPQHELLLRGFKL